MGLLLEAGHTIGRHLNCVVAVAGIGRRVQHTDVGANTANDHIVGPTGRQYGFQTCIEETAVPVLWYHVVLSHELRQFGNDVGLLSTLDAVDREHVEFQVVGVVVVRDEENLRPCRLFPDQQIVLDHCGTPLNIACYHGKLHDRFDGWRRSIRAIAECPNVAVKLGGLAMAFCGLPDTGPDKGHGSEHLAGLWRPYIETCIEAFGADRAMFESNYPVDRWGASYPVLWNAFKRLSQGYSATERAAMFQGTAERVYRVVY